MPWLWWVSRVCDEFGCLPSVAVREMMDTPAGWLEDIVEMRAFARARALKAKAEEWPDGKERRAVMADPLVQLAQMIEFEGVPRG